MSKREHESKQGYEIGTSIPSALDVIPVGKPSLTSIADDDKDGISNNELDLINDNSSYPEEIRQRAFRAPAVMGLEDTDPILQAYIPSTVPKHAPLVESSALFDAPRKRYLLSHPQPQRKALELFAHEVCCSIQMYLKSQY